MTAPRGPARYTNKLPPGSAAALGVGAQAIVGTLGRVDLHVGEVVRLTNKLLVVHYQADKQTIPVRFRKNDALEFGGGGRYLLDPEQPEILDRLARQVVQSGPAAHRAVQRPPSPRPSSVPMLTVAEVAVELRVSKMTVYRLARTGELPSLRIGRSFRFTERAVDDYLRRAADWDHDDGAA